jgi:hypothetical protein
MVVEILAKNPEIATIPIPGDGRSPLQCAVDLGCDAPIIGIFEHHEAERARIDSCSDLRGFQNLGMDM